MATAEDTAARIHELEDALRHERARSTELEKRAATLEDSARRAYQLAAFGTTRREVSATTNLPTRAEGSAP